MRDLDGKLTKLIHKARYVVPEKEAEVVGQIFARALAGRTIRAVTIELTRRRVSPRRTGAWSRSTISKMLYDSSYCGEGYAYKHRLAKVRRRKVAR